MNSVPSRRSPRLAEFDYSQPGIYFVTVCTWDRTPLLGEIVAGKMHMSRAGHAELQAWIAFPLRFPDIDLDAFVVMPNHIHGILLLGGDPEFVHGPSRPTLATVMRVFKSVSGIQGNRALGRANQPFWQRSFHDRIVRNARELTRIRQYIADNPARWETDVDNPSPISSLTDRVRHP